jgi:iron-sulfur cluster repair protein YtfE (RIC family)
MSVKTPFKRAKELQSITVDHHNGLLLSRKIRIGFNKNIELQRIKNYADWYFENQVVPHLKLEEELLFPILGNQNELIKRALTEHRRLRRLFKKTDQIEKTLVQIEEEIESHIRFEEHILYVEIQKVATAQQLVKIEEIHSKFNFIENEEDPFWN